MPVQERALGALWQRARVMLQGSDYRSFLHSAGQA